MTATAMAGAARDAIRFAMRRLHVVVTGYMDDSDNVFCAACWTKAKAIGGAASVLDTADPKDPDDKTPFWVIDKRVLCCADVKYKDVRMIA